MPRPFPPPPPEGSGSETKSHIILQIHHLPVLELLQYSVEAGGGGGAVQEGQSAAWLIDSMVRIQLRMQ